MDLELEIKGPGAHAISKRRGWIVLQVGIMHRKVDRIDAESIHAAIQPELRNRQHRILHNRIMHIDLRLAA